MLFDETITLYNHYKEDGKDRWKRTLLGGCMWFDDIVKTVNDRGMVNMAKVVEVTIILQEGYKTPKEWNHKDGWTLNADSNLDLMVLGNCSVELSSAEDLKALKKIKDVRTVSEVVDNTPYSLLRHWRVIAK